MTTTINPRLEQLEKLFFATVAYGDTLKAAITHGAKYELPEIDLSPLTDKGIRDAFMRRMYCYDQPETWLAAKTLFSTTVLTTEGTDPEFASEVLTIIGGLSLLEGDLRGAREWVSISFQLADEKQVERPSLGGLLDVGFRRLGEGSIDLFQKTMVRFDENYLLRINA